MIQIRSLSCMPGKGSAKEGHPVEIFNGPPGRTRYIPGTRLRLRQSKLLDPRTRSKT